MSRKCSKTIEPPRGAPQTHTEDTAHQGRQCATQSLPLAQVPISATIHGRGAGVEGSLGVGEGLAVGVGVGVAVGIAVTVGVGVGVGADWTSKEPTSVRPFTTRSKPGPRWS